MIDTIIIFILLIRNLSQECLSDVPKVAELVRGRWRFAPRQAGSGTDSTPVPDASLNTCLLCQILFQCFTDIEYLNLLTVL